VFISEACTNVVVHAYVGTSPGPLYAAATLADRDLIVSVCDCGRGMVAHPDSAGAGLGVPLMTRDRLWMASAAAGEGTWVHGTFGRAIAAPARATSELTRHDDRGAMLREYLCVLEADHAALGEDTDAVLAQARHVVARVRRQRRDAPDDAKACSCAPPWRRARLNEAPRRAAGKGRAPRALTAALNAVATPRQSESVRAQTQDAWSSSKPAATPAAEHCCFAPAMRGVSRVRAVTAQTIRTEPGCRSALPQVGWRGRSITAGPFPAAPGRAVAELPAEAYGPAVE
jgi:hypothetical protein